MILLSDDCYLLIKVQLLNIMEMNDGTHSVILLLLLKETSKHYIIFIK